MDLWMYKSHSRTGARVDVITGRKSGKAEDEGEDVVGRGMGLGLRVWMNAAWKKRKCQTKGRFLMLHKANKMATVLHRLPGPPTRFAAADRRLRTFSASICGVRRVAGFSGTRAGMKVARGGTT